MTSSSPLEQLLRGRLDCSSHANTPVPAQLGSQHPCLPLVLQALGNSTLALWVCPHSSPCFVLAQLLWCAPGALCEHLLILLDNTASVELVLMLLLYKPCLSPWNTVLLLGADEASLYFLFLHLVIMLKNWDWESQPSSSFCGIPKGRKWTLFMSIKNFVRLPMLREPSKALFL